MYLSPLTAESRPEELQRVIRDYPLGVLVTSGAAGMDANHLPFLLDENRGPNGTLIAHVARANPLWTEVADGDVVLVVFRGAHGYISPNWLESKHETHRQVPTWNYEVVHAHGTIRIHDDEKAVRGVVARLTRQHEAPLPQPWKMSDAPADYLAGQLRRIVGIEIEIVRLVGKRKLGQDEAPRDFASTIQALEQLGQLDLADAMKRARPARPNEID